MGSTSCSPTGSAWSAAAGDARCTSWSRAGPPYPPDERTVPATARDYRALIIASEPTNGGAWAEIPERSMFEVTPDLRLRIEPLDES